MIPAGIVMRVYHIRPTIATNAAIASYPSKSGNGGRASFNAGKAEMMKTKKLVVIRGKGTKNETRIETNVTLYWSERHQMWFSIPEKEKR